MMMKKVRLDVPTTICLRAEKIGYILDCIIWFGKKFGCPAFRPVISWRIFKINFHPQV